MQTLKHIVVNFHFFDDDDDDGDDDLVSYILSTFEDIEDMRTKNMTGIKIITPRIFLHNNLETRRLLDWGNLYEKLSTPGWSLSETQIIISENQSYR